jgi:sulfur carrier protein
MSIIVNGQIQPLPEPSTIESLLIALAPKPPFAVAHNEEFVPRSNYIDRRVEPGDRIEIVHPMAGG